jgi:hypothetical protein
MAPGAAGRGHCPKRARRIDLGTVRKIWQGAPQGTPLLNTLLNTLLLPSLQVGTPLLNTLLMV